MPADGTERLTAAARRRHEQTLARARAALRRFETTGETVTYAKAAAAAKVSRAWLYSQPDIPTAVDRLRDINNRSTGVAVPPASAPAKPAWSAASRRRTAATKSSPGKSPNSETSSLPPTARYATAARDDPSTGVLTRPRALQ